jgi:hypothetical protein
LSSRGHIEYCLFLLSWILCHFQHC